MVRQGRAYMVSDQPIICEPCAVKCGHRALIGWLRADHFIARGPMVSHNTTVAKWSGDQRAKFFDTGANPNTGHVTHLWLLEDSGLRAKCGCGHRLSATVNDLRAFAESHQGDEAATYQMRYA